MAPSGCVDTTIVRIRSPSELDLDPEDYVCKNRCKSPFVLFQTVVSLGTNRLVHLDGPFKGRAADVTIARETIVPYLRDGERLLADAGYRYEGESSMIVAPGGRSVNMTSEERKFAGKVHQMRQNVERVYARMKEFEVMNGVWRYDLKFLQNVVFVVGRLTNVKLLYMPLNADKK